MLGISKVTTILLLVQISMNAAKSVKSRYGDHCKDFTLDDCPLVPNTIIDQHSFQIPQCVQWCSIINGCLLWLHDGRTCFLLETDNRDTCHISGAPVDGDVQDCITNGSGDNLNTCDGYIEMACSYTGQHVAGSPTKPGQVTDEEACKLNCMLFECKYWVFDEEARVCNMYDAGTRQCFGLSGPNPNHAPSMQECGIAEKTTPSPTTTITDFPDEKCFFEDGEITFHDLGQNHYGQDTKPEWIIDQGGHRLIETENTRPSVGVSNLGDPTKPVSFTGRLFSNYSDSDVIGLVFGYHNEANFFVVASASTNSPGPTNWYVGRLHATCGQSCSETTTISDAIWDPIAHPDDITILMSGTMPWQYPNIYDFSICFDPSKLLLNVTITLNDEPALASGTISGKTNKPEVDDVSRQGGFVGVYVDSQELTTWDQLGCDTCNLS